MRFYEFAPLKEISTSGSTSSGNVASVVKPIQKKDVIGQGFDSSGDHGIYQKKKRVKLGTPAIIRRIV